MGRSQSRGGDCWLPCRLPVSLLVLMFRRMKANRPRLLLRCVGLRNHPSCPVQEFQFEFVGQDLQATLEALFTAPLSTGMCEDAFHELRSVARGCEGQRISRKNRWATLTRAKVASMYNRPQVQVVEEDYGDAETTFPKSFFEAKGHKVSCAEELQRFQETTWTLPSPSSWGLIPQALETCMQLQSFARIKQAWQALIFQQGDLIVARDKPTQGFMVLAVSKWGLVLWPSRGAYARGESSGTSSKHGACTRQCRGSMWRWPAWRTGGAPCLASCRLWSSPQALVGPEHEAGCASPSSRSRCGWCTWLPSAPSRGSA